MKARTRTTIVALATLCMLSTGTVATLAADDGPTYAVTVTNLTRGQVLAPPLVISHDAKFKLFAPGEPAGSELAEMAEDAVTGPLMALLGTMSGVQDFDLGADVVPPGGSMTVEVEASGRFRRITVAGMLVTTNDAFFAGTTSISPRGRSGAFAAIAYDAGSEANTESCEHIPGPPCMNPLVRVTEGAEGFVHVHAGIHGGADLMPGSHDWRNPVAHVKIERID